MKISNFLLILFLSGCAASTKNLADASGKKEPPKILKPVVRKIWIPPEIRNGGDEWVEGHYLYRIEKEATWSR